MAGMYDVGPSMQGGSGAINPGANAFYGMQQELMRRQQQQAATAALERQRQLDEQKQADDEAKRQLAADALAQQKEHEASQAAVEQANTISPGPTTPETAAILRAAGRAHLILGKPGTPAVAAVPAVPADTNYEGQPETPEVAAVPAGAPTESYAGLPAQQKEAAQQAAMQHILATAPKGSPMYQWAEGELTGHAPPAGIAAPKSAQETLSERELKVRDILAKPEASRSPEENATVSGEQAYGELKAGPAEARAAAAAEASDARQARTIAAAIAAADKRAGQKTDDNLIKTVTTDHVNTRKSYDISTKALAGLDAHTAVSDKAAIPQFLQIEAGGQGSGLRMTAIEIKQVQDAQKIGSTWLEAASRWIPGMTQYSLSDTQRAQMRAAIALVNRKAKEALANQSDSVRKAGSPSLADYWDQDMQIVGGGETAPATPAAAAPTTTPALAKRGLKF